MAAEPIEQRNVAGLNTESRSILTTMLVWSSKFETGVPEVDADHQRLVTALNRLEELLQKGAGSKVVNELLDFLGRYADQHFKREEACMHRLSCPTAAANISAHAQFMATFAKAREKLDNPNAGALVVRQVHTQLCDWIENHILKIDMGLKSCPKTAAPTLAKVTR